MDVILVGKVNLVAMLLGDARQVTGKGVIHGQANQSEIPISIGRNEDLGKIGIRWVGDNVKVNWSFDHYMKVRSSLLNVGPVTHSL